MQNQQLTQDEYQELLKLRAEKQAREARAKFEDKGIRLAAKTRAVVISVGKGWPVTLYGHALLELLDKAALIREFYEQNRGVIAMEAPAKE